MTLTVGESKRIEIVRGDLTREAVGAIVNAANTDLLPGGGVCGAIHRAGGPTIASECRDYIREHGRLSTGQAVATTAGALAAQYVIHTPGPVWHGGKAGEPEALASSYRESIRVADDLGLDSIAFPSISTGIYGYPVELAAPVALVAIREALEPTRILTLVRLVLFDEATLAAYQVAGRSE